MPRNISIVGHDLSDIDLFRELRGSELKTVASSVTCTEYADGESLFREGESDRTVFSILEGCVKVVKETQDGTQIRLARLRTGMSLGEMALVEDARRSAGAVADGRVVAIRLSRDSFERVCEHNPRIGLKIQRALLVALSQRLRRTSARYADVSPT